jgi:hypothetical protein
MPGNQKLYQTTIRISGTLDGHLAKWDYETVILA